MTNWLPMRSTPRPLGGRCAVSETKAPTSRKLSSFGVARRRIMTSVKSVLWILIVTLCCTVGTRAAAGPTATVGRVVIKQHKHPALVLFTAGQQPRQRTRQGGSAQL